jgi:hypothetical protein
MDESIMEIGRIIRNTIKEPLIILMEISIKEVSRMDSFIMKELLSIILDVFIKENIDWVRKKVKVNFS